MVKVIMGVQGTGKTKRMINMVNEAAQTEHGTVVCIEYGDRMIFDLKWDVRLVDYSKLPITKSMERFKGFLSGMYASNFDITHFFIDSLNKLADPADMEEVDDFLRFCEGFSNELGVKFTMMLSADQSEATETIKNFL